MLSLTRLLTTANRLHPTTIVVSAILFSAVPYAQAAIDVDENRYTLTTASSTMINSNDSIDNKCQNLVAQKRYIKYQSAHARTISCMLAQLTPYQQKDKTSQQQYFAYKAQAWLNYAYHKDSINSQSKAGKDAYEQGKTILTTLKEGTEQNLRITTDIPKTSALMRPDLWALLHALKDSGAIANAPRELAFSEVSLIWAAADHCARGWRESSSHFRMADRWLEQAREAYVNAHDSQSNVALEDATVDYYTQYAPLDPSDDICRGQILPLASANNMSSSRPINMPTPTATYSLSFE